MFSWRWRAPGGSDVQGRGWGKGLDMRGGRGVPAGNSIRVQELKHV